MKYVGFKWASRVIEFLLEPESFSRHRNI